MYLNSGYYIGLVVRREQMAQLYEIRAQLSSWLSIAHQLRGKKSHERTYTQTTSSLPTDTNQTFYSSFYCIQQSE
ncbi:hypothetical protein [Vibrio penaeicida]|uniref:hypothetical protein n=1 Tax=Vibrio penaeicida TaxID=104609 RepID=UPI000F818E4D|nr:hypothetical protein [Vibrio penaeicida]RTZ21922.1 hypothetical protein EKN09_16810 [Vibrio penaeicida]